MSFIFGGNTQLTYDQVQKQREVANALLTANMRTPQNVGEGLSAIGRALAARAIDKRTGREEARLRDEFNAKWGALFSGAGGGSTSYAGGGGSPSGTWTPAAPGPGPVEQMTEGMDVAKAGGLSFGENVPKADPGMIGGGQEKLGFGAAVMTPQEMLIEGAKARGLDPIDVATAISYETGGKFDPMLSGPTTQWGTHRGLIQFGEPQAQQHGVDFTNSDTAWRSQLNPTSGAIWSYLDGAGVKPGMGLDQIYSAINAGSVGRMGASDANNGGAPGTVADKVAGMGPHRQNAAAFLGGTWTPNPGQGGAPASGGGSVVPMGMDIGALVSLASDPMASPAQKAIIEQLIGQQLAMADPLRQIEMQKAQLELAQLQNPTAKPVNLETFTGADGVVYSFNPMTGETKALTGAEQDKPKPYSDIGQIQADLVNGLITPEQAQTATEALAKGGTSVTVNNGNGGELPGLSKLGEGYTYIYNPDGTIKLDPQGLPMSAPIPGGPADAKAQEAAAEAAALEAKGKNKTTQGKLKLGATLENLNLNIAEIENGGLPVTGAIGDARRTWVGRLFTGDSAMDFGNRNSQITDSAALAEVQNMRDNSPTGGAVGSLTDDERRAIGNAVTAMNASTSPEEYVRAAKAYRKLALDIAYGEGTWELDENGQPQIKGTAAAPPQASSGGAPDADGWTTLPNGVKVRVKQ